MSKRQPDPSKKQQQAEITRAVLAAQSESRQAHRRSIRETWWPSVDTAESAAKVARYGFWAVVINVILAALLVVVLLSGGGVRDIGDSKALLPWAIGEFLLFLPLAWGLYRYALLAAWLALAAFVASKLLGWALLVQTPSPTALLIAALFLMFYVHGVRGCQALARLRRA